MNLKKQYEKCTKCKINKMQKNKYNNENLNQIMQCKKIK